MALALNQSVILGTAGVGARITVRGFHPALQKLTEQVLLSWNFRYTMAVVLKGAQGGERGLFKGKRFSSLPLVRLEFSNQRSKKDFSLGFCLEPTVARCCHGAKGEGSEHGKLWLSHPLQHHPLFTQKHQHGL